MQRRILSVCCSALLLAATARSAEPTRVAPFYSIAAVGTWVEYRITEVDAARKPHTGRLRITVGGTERHDGVTYHWIEMDQKTTQDDKTIHKVRRFLIADVALAAGPSWDGNVRAAYAKSGDDKEERALTATEIKRLLTMGFEGPQEGLHKASKSETVHTKLGNFQAHKVTATARHGELELTYKAWLTDKVPFGWVKLEVREKSADETTRLVYRAEVLREGRERKDK
jgi:hypothetical protein